jgi:hypothetical protein
LQARGLVQVDYARMDSVPATLPAGTVRDGRLGVSGTIPLPGATWTEISLAGASSGSKVVPEAGLAAGWRPGSWNLEARAESKRCDDGIRVRTLNGRELSGKAIVGWNLPDRIEWEARANRDFVSWDGGNVTRWGGWSWAMVRVLRWKILGLKLGAAASWADASRDLNHATGSVQKTAQVDDTTSVAYYKYSYAVDPVPVALDQWQALGLASGSIALGSRAFVTVSGGFPLWYVERRTSAWPDSGLTALPTDGGSSSWWRSDGGTWQGSIRLDSRVGAWTWMAVEASASRNPDYWSRKLSVTVNTPIP